VSKRLIALDVLLLAVCGVLAWQLRQEWLQEHSREIALFRYRTHPPAATPLLPLIKPVPFDAAAYAEVAQNDLFSKDRNPNVILDPPKDPPPPPPVPPFPVARGVMLWEGVPPTIVLSERPGGQQKSYHPGDKIGPWKVVGLDDRFVTFAWNDQEFKKRIDELLDNTPVETVAPPPANTATAAAAPTAPPANLSNSSSPVGVDTGAGNRGCVAGDSSPAGTIVDGYKKVMTENPFGHSCSWQSVK
jgi:hypothetical protein